MSTLYPYYFLSKHHILVLQANTGASFIYGYTKYTGFDEETMTWNSLATHAGLKSVSFYFLYLIFALGTKQFR